MTDVLLLFPAVESSNRRVQYHWDAARSQFRICWLLEDLQWLYRHAADYRLQRKARCQNEGRASCMGDIR